MSLAFLLGALVLVATAWLRGPEYDEQYTVFLATGEPRPNWPATVFQPGQVRHVFTGSSSLGSIAQDLRRHDVHPPLYFWAAAAWRGVVGPDLFATRLLSVLFALAALGLVGLVAREIGVPPVAAMLLTLGCYGFVYTGALARGFALAQLLLVGGALLALVAARRGHAGMALCAGVLLGAAAFANYLAVFVAGAVLFWLVLQPVRRVALAGMATLGFLPCLPACLWFFVGQNGTRPNQFPDFSLPSALARLAQYGAANLVGGLPLYLPEGLARMLASAAVGVLALGLAGLVAWWCIGPASADRTRWLPVLGLLAPPAGLLLLGATFSNTPIELRYLVFAVPFACLLLAGAFAALPQDRMAGRVVLPMLLAVQAAALAGMMLRPETMQPWRAAAKAATALAAGEDALVVISYGNDGVGIPAGIISEAPDDMNMVLARAAPDTARILAEAREHARLVLVIATGDAASREAVGRLKPVIAADPCWRQDGASAYAVAWDNTCRRALSQTDPPSR